MIQSPLKWVGSKNRITDLILEHTPKSFQNYHESFLGSGSVFLAVKQNIAGTRNWYLSDANPHLICLWKAIQSDIRNLNEMLRSLKNRYETADRKSTYQTIRAEFNAHEALDTEKAALFMFLCRTSFNGLVRYNSKGHFNAAWGSRNKGDSKDLFLFEENHFTNINKILTDNVFFTCQSYEFSDCQEDDFSFFDPPYVPIEENRQIDKLAYCKEGFDINDQIRFANWCSEKDKQGVRLMITNHDTPFVREHFKNFSFLNYNLRKTFSGSASSRKKTSEVIIKNF